MWSKISITAVIVLLCGGFFSYKNMEALDQEKSAKEEAQQELDKTNGLIADEKTKLEDAKQKANSYKAESEALEKQLAELKTEGDGLNSKISTSKTELENITKELADIQEKMKDIQKAKEMLNEIEQLKQDKASLEHTLATETSKKDTLEARFTELDGAIAALNKLAADQRARISPASLKTTINNVMGEWGYVIINAGGNSGVVLQSTLAVVRDGEKIAELKVTNVEMNRSTASIIPSSMVDGTQLLPGDQVVSVRPR